MTKDREFIKDHEFIPEIACFTDQLTSETIVRWKNTHKDIPLIFHKGNSPRLLWDLSKVTADRLTAVSKDSLVISWKPYKTTGVYTIITRQEAPLSCRRINI